MEAGQLRIAQLNQRLQSRNGQGRLLAYLGRCVRQPGRHVLNLRVFIMC